MITFLFYNYSLVLLLHCSLNSVLLVQAPDHASSGPSSWYLYTGSSSRFVPCIHTPSLVLVLSLFSLLQPFLRATFGLHGPVSSSMSALVPVLTMLLHLVANWLLFWALRPRNCVEGVKGEKQNPLNYAYQSSQCKNNCILGVYLVKRNITNKEKCIRFFILIHFFPNV